jgi:hypothetical protein
MATSHGHHGGMKMGGSSVGHPHDPIGGLNGGPTSGFPPGELILLGESPSCPLGRMMSITSSWYRNW